MPLLLLLLFMVLLQGHAEGAADHSLLLLCYLKRVGCQQHCCSSHNHAT
jgi:hypothetical protein